MSFKDELLDLLEKERELRRDEKLRSSCEIPGKCYLLGDETVVCYPRSDGDSRYPYSHDGFTLWAHSSGYMSLNESAFYYILPSSDGRDPYVNFWGGLKNGDGFTPVSVTGAARQPLEETRRFTAYTPYAAYYIAKSHDFVFALRAFVSDDKKACFSVCALDAAEWSAEFSGSAHRRIGGNVGRRDDRGRKKEIYLAAYFNCLMMSQSVESVETKWFKRCFVSGDGFRLESVEDLDRTTHVETFGKISRRVEGQILRSEHTASRADFAGGVTGQLNCSPSLFSGRFESCKSSCGFSETAAAGDIYVFDSDGFVRVDYVVEVCENAENPDADAFRGVTDADAVRGVTGADSHGTYESAFGPAVAGARPRAEWRSDADWYADVALSRIKAADERCRVSERAFDVEFGRSDASFVDGEILTRFLRNVERQTEFAALAKNSGVSLLGMRDCAQQLEAALIWKPEECRKKICELMNYVDPSGRVPRQYSVPSGNALPKMDTREYIDQGIWIIDLLYSYLAYTGDGGLLDEICGYYVIIGDGAVERTDVRDSVYCHLFRICGYLMRNTDEETGCLHALYGDWNDALDGLGVSRDGSSAYGTGVSVMASLQFYRNLSELLEIVAVYGDPTDMGPAMKASLTRMEEGLSKYAVETSEAGARRIIHGWGDGRSYKVGSFCDSDGKSRDGLTSNAFWVISGMYKLDASIKDDILGAYGRLDGKYGLKTFEPFFDRDVPGVGRIINLPRGTAENSGTYVHATLFGIWSLFLMGECDLAWEQLRKVLPVTHSDISTSPFVMSNSYLFNEELMIDGESMNDWYTGSANTLIKVVVRCVFGVEPDLSGIGIFPCADMPFETATMKICVRGKRFSFRYTKAPPDTSIPFGVRTPREAPTSRMAQTSRGAPTSRVVQTSIENPISREVRMSGGACGFHGTHVSPMSRPERAIFRDGRKLDLVYDAERGVYGVYVKYEEFSDFNEIEISG